MAALIGHGGYTEVIYLKQEHLVCVPASVEPGEAVAVVLNYASAYQMLHRVARVENEDKVLITGASGGMGTALLDLGRMAGLKMYATASPGKHVVLTSFGAIPLDYHASNWTETLCQLEPEGLDFIFDGTSHQESDLLALLRQGGKLVAYSAPTGVWSMLAGGVKIAITNLLPNGKSAEFYGITALYLRDKRPFMEDVPRLFQCLEEGKIHPVISARLPLLEAQKANELLESGQLAGNIVLLSPELL
ncbi:MAG TPA: zinc-binding dehydrogenase [Candidatus Acidoferrum sp.]|nr:zinc-binding dehydrogenase [Candidatus Acidoferrum sp.]